MSDANHKPELLRRLAECLPTEAILWREELLPYECDGLSAYRELPMVVVLPDRAEQVQAILRLCHQMPVPVVARGAGTGLSGGSARVGSMRCSSNVQR